MLEKVIKYLFIGLQPIDKKLGAVPPESLTDDEQKLMFVLDDLFMIYAFEHSFNNSKDNPKPKNIEKLYYFRKLVSPKVLFTRIVMAFMHNFANRP